MLTDKRDKFLQWDRIGELALVQHWDAYIFTTEVWFAPLPEPPVLYPDVAGTPGRRELLVTYVEANDGTFEVWTSEIVRVLGKGYLKKVRQDFVDHEVGFPLRPRLGSPRRAFAGVGWSILGRRSSGGGDRRRPPV